MYRWHKWRQASHTVECNFTCTRIEKQNADEVPLWKGRADCYPSHVYQHHPSSTSPGWSRAQWSSFSAVALGALTAGWPHHSPWFRHKEGDGAVTKHLNKESREKARRWWRKEREVTFGDERGLMMKTHYKLTHFSHFSLVTVVLHQQTLCMSNRQAFQQSTWKICATQPLIVLTILAVGEKILNIGPRNYWLMTFSAI